MSAEFGWMDGREWMDGTEEEFIPQMLTLHFILFFSTFWI
jgi:hypothetical protein